MAWGRKGASCRERPRGKRLREERVACEGRGMLLRFEEKRFRAMGFS